MSASKRLFFDRNSLDDPVRASMQCATANYLSEFTHRLPMKRRATKGLRHWDKLWPISVEQAVRELGVDVVRINGGMFTRLVAERDAIKCRAEELWALQSSGQSVAT